jgi:hypothetical protein
VLTTYVGDRPGLADWATVAPNPHGVDEVWTYWFLSDHTVYSGTRMDSPFAPSTFPGITDAQKQRVRAYGVFVKNYSYTVDPQKKEPKEVTTPYFVLLHMEPDFPRSGPMHQNAFFWVTVSMILFGILFYVVLIRGERKEAAKSEAHRMELRRRARGVPPAAGPTPTGGAGGTPGTGPPP